MSTCALSAASFAASAVTRGCSGASCTLVAPKMVSTRVVKTRIFSLRLFDREINLGAFAAADPVALHGAHFFRPAVELVEAVEQLLRIRGDAEEPLHQVALLHDRVFVPPAAAVDDLLIGEHGGALAGTS